MNKEIIIILSIFVILFIRKNKEHWFGSSWYHSAAHAVTHTPVDVGHAVAHTATDAADTVAHTATAAADTVAHTAVGSAVIGKAERWGPRLLNLAFKSIKNPKELLGVLLKQVDCKEIILHLDVKYIIKHMKSVKELRHYLHNEVEDYIWDKSPTIIKEMVNMHRELEDYIETLIDKLVNEKLIMLLGGAAEERIKHIIAKNLCNLI